LRASGSPAFGKCHRPGGTAESSPAIHCRGRRTFPYLSPGGTTEALSRPFGTACCGASATGR
jgi:hypothetical protein